MAKSTRSKVKRSFRAKKREEGVYAANEAARLQRLSSKLAAIRDEEPPLTEEDKVEEIGEGERLGKCYLLGLDLPNPEHTRSESMRRFQYC